MKRWTGRWYMVVAVLHTTLAFMMFRQQWFELMQAGLIDAVTVSPLHGKAVWFGLFGVLLFLFGAVVDALERRGQPMPAAAAAGTLLLAILGILLMPRSGFWLVLPPALAAVARQFRRPSAHTQNLDRPAA